MAVFRGGRCVACYINQFTLTVTHVRGIESCQFGWGFVAVFRSSRSDAYFYNYYTLKVIYDREIESCQFRLGVFVRLVVLGVFSVVGALLTTIIDL